QSAEGFGFGDMLGAHAGARAAGLEDMTDDAAVAEWAGLPVALVLGSAANAKLTIPEDFAMAESAAGGPDVRVGQGFDVHRLVAGDHVWLCGVRIAPTPAPEGHSHPHRAPPPPPHPGPCALRARDIWPPFSRSAP